MSKQVYATTEEATERIIEIFRAVVEDANMAGHLVREGEELLAVIDGQEGQSDTDE